MKVCVMYNIRFTRMNCLWLGKTKEKGSHMKVCAIYIIRFTQMNYLWLGNTKETVSQIKGVCDIRHAVHSDELFALRHENRNVQMNKMCVIRGKQVCNRKCGRGPITTQTITPIKMCVLWANDCWYTIVSDWWKHHRRVPLFSQCAMWFSLSAHHLCSVYRASTYILKKTTLHNQIKHTITQVTTHITFPHTKVSNYMHTKVGETRIQSSTYCCDDASHCSASGRIPDRFGGRRHFVMSTIRLYM